MSCVAADEELAWPLDDEELGEGGTGPIALIVPGVVAFDGRVIITGSPIFTVGALSGLSGTVTMRVVDVASRTAAPACSDVPSVASSSLTRISPGATTASPSRSTPFTTRPRAAWKARNAVSVADEKCGDEANPDPKPSAERFVLSSATSGPSLTPGKSARDSTTDP